MLEALVPDGLWERVAPLLPPPKPRRYRHPGRRPIDDRAALAGIVLMLKTGIHWNQLPTSLVGCSGVTCWRRLRDWTEVSVWPALHELLLAQLRALGELNLDRCAVDGSRVERSKGDRRRPVAGRSRPSGLQAPPHRRRRWHPARGEPDRRQPPRRHPAHSAGGCRSADPGPGAAGPAGDRGSSSPTAATTATVTADSCAPAASPLGSPAAASRTARAWAASAGWSSAASPGCTPSSSYAPATSVAPTSIWACSSWLVR